MKILKKDVTFISVNLNTSQKSGKTYVNMNFVDEEGNYYNIISDKLELSQQIKTMDRWKVDLNLTSNAKYGMKLEITNFIEKI